jgi:hypothetical protein
MDDFELLKVMIRGTSTTLHQFKTAISISKIPAQINERSNFGFGT